MADYGFFAVLALASLLFYRTIEAVIVPVVLGASLAVLVRSWNDRLARALGAPRAAAVLTTLAVMLVFIVPAVLLGWAVVQELVSAATSLASRVGTDDPTSALARIPGAEWLGRTFKLEADDMKRVADATVSGSARLARQLLSTAAGLFAGGFLLVLSLYYFLVDGPRWFRDVERLAPIEPRYVRAFAREFDQVSHALFFGSLVTAAIQGLSAWLGYRIFGVPQPMLWGAATALMSLTPVIGTAVVWSPIALVIGFTDSWLTALGVAAWGALVTGTVDNVAKPLLMKGRMRLHPLVVFLSILGGVAAFGLVGILAGPLAAALFLAAVRIYDRDYRARLLAPDELPPPLS